MNSVDYFDGHVLKYDRWYDRYPEIFTKEVKFLKDVANIKHPAVEIGVGTGRFAKELRVDFGIDPAFNMLKLAKEKGLDVICGAGENLPLESDFFSTVLMIITIEFVSDPEKVLEESRRVLRQDGNLVIAFIESDSDLGSGYQRKGGFYASAKFFTEKKLIGMIKDIGYTEINIYHSQISGFSAISARALKNHDKGES